MKKILLGIILGVLLGGCAKEVGTVADSSGSHLLRLASSLNSTVPLRANQERFTLTSTESTFGYKNTKRRIAALEYMEISSGRKCQPAESGRTASEPTVYYSTWVIAQFGCVAVVTATYAMPWQNAKNRFDVNGDGVESPLDVLALTNSSIKMGILGARPSGQVGSFVDLNGDGIFDQRDILEQINHNNEKSKGEGEKETPLREDQERFTLTSTESTPGYKDTKRKIISLEYKEIGSGNLCRPAQTGSTASEPTVYFKTWAIVQFGCSAVVTVTYHMPWQNLRNRFDVNGDGVVSLLDLLAFRNYANLHPEKLGKNLGSRPVSQVGNYVDIDGDGYFTPNDVQLINSNFP